MSGSCVLSQEQCQQQVFHFFGLQCTVWSLRAVYLLVIKAAPFYLQLWVVLTIVLIPFYIQITPAVAIMAIGGLWLALNDPFGLCQLFRALDDPTQPTDSNDVDYIDISDNAAERLKRNKKANEKRREEQRDKKREDES
jgi:hypothetical protein